jgi:hypothetical protein
MLSLLADAVTYNYTTVNSTGSGGMGVGLVVMLLYVAFIALAIVTMWKLFVKAGEPGWKSIVPFYNTWTMFEIAGKPGWWLFLGMIPFVNIVVGVIMALELAKRFNKSSTFAVFGLILFSLVGYMILAFGDAKYDGKKYVSGTPAAPAAPTAPAATA